MNAVAPAGAASLDRTALGAAVGDALWRPLQALADPLVVVGGFVRDLLLGRETHDLDVVVPSGGLALASRLADVTGGAFVALDPARDTGRVVLTGPDGQPFFVDVAAWRAESLEADLRQRDFTVNALAARVDRAAVALVDVTGGLADLNQRLLRTTSEQALPEDPLRCLRAVRLAAELSPWGFRLDGGAADQIRQHAPLVATCAGERVRDELVRIVSASQPDRWLRLLAGLDLLAAVLPEAEALRQETQPAPRADDLWERTVQTVGIVAWLAGWIAGQDDPRDDVDRAACLALAPYRPALASHLGQRVGVALGSREQALRWAALCHAWGTPATSGRAHSGFTSSESSEPPAAGLAQEALRRLRFSEAETRWVTTVVSGHQRPYQLAGGGPTVSRRAIYRYYRDLGAAGVDAALLGLAGHRAAMGSQLNLTDWQRQLATVVSLLDAYLNRREEVVNPPPLVDGHDVMAALRLPPGRLVGHVLAAIAEAQAAGEVSSPEQALAHAAQIVNALPDGS